MPTEKPRLRKREVGLAVGLGGLAALGAGGILFEIADSDNRREAQAEQVGVTYDVGPFDAVEVNGPQDVAITLGDTISVTAEGRADAVAGFEAVVEEGRLLIRPRDGFSLSAGIDFDDVVFRVTLPSLRAVRLAGSGDVLVDRVEGEAFTGELEGSGDLQIENLLADRAELAVNGSGDIDASGVTQDLWVAVAGSGSVDTAGLTAAAATITVEGSGDVEVMATRTATVSLQGSGDVEVNGPASCSITSAGTGEVRCYGAGGSR